MSSPETPDGAILMPTAAIAINEGDVCMVTSYNMALTTDVDSNAVAVSAQSSYDDAGAALTLTAGDLWPFYPLGCCKVVNVRSLTGQTWRFGALVYLDQTSSTNGCVETSSSNSAEIVGTYVGPDNVLTSGVTLIRVLLNRFTGATA